MLHDCHAEVLALRGFNRWVLDELEHMVLDPSYQFNYFQQAFDLSDDSLGPDSTYSPFAFKDDVSLHFFTTEAPCGDASMELLIRSKPAEEAVPWTDLSSNVAEGGGAALLGRGYFSQLGTVRRKPARGDAEATMSKSCTDKLALKQFTSLLSFPADILVRQTPNCFIQSLVVYQDQYDELGYERALGSRGRLTTTANSAQFFKIETLLTSFPRFDFEKGSSEASFKASNISALWIRGHDASPDTVEVLLNGVKQGFKQFELRQGKESAVCRKQMWYLGLKIEALVPPIHQDDPAAQQPTLLSVNRPTYRDAKHGAARSARRHMKFAVTQSLEGWISNTGDEAWSLK